MTQFDQITKVNKEFMDGSLAAVASMTKTSQAVAAEVTDMQNQQQKQAKSHSKN